MQAEAARRAEELFPNLSDGDFLPADFKEDEEARGRLHGTPLHPAGPAGVGIMGRGRSAVNARLSSDGTTVEALQRRRLSLLSKAEFRPMRSVVKQIQGANLCKIMQVV